MLNQRSIRTERGIKLPRLFLFGCILTLHNCAIYTSLFEINYITQFSCLSSLYFLVTYPHIKWVFCLLCGMKWFIINASGIKWAKQFSEKIVARTFTASKCFREMKSHKKIIMLIGEYTHTLDDKNRMSLPVKFRAAMGKKVVLAPGLDNCLSIFTAKEWEKISSKLSDSSMLASDNRSFSRFMFGQAVGVDVDSNGRILIPENLKIRSGLTSKVVVIGVQNRAEIWNEKTWNDYKKVVEKQADALADKLGQIGVL